MSFGRISAGARVWSTFAFQALIEELEHDSTYRAKRNLPLAHDYSIVAPLNLARRQNKKLAPKVVADEDQTRQLQEYGIWSEAAAPIIEYFMVCLNYADRSSQAMELGNTFGLALANDTVRIGADSPFNNIDFLHDTFGVGAAFTVKYWDGGAWVAVAGLSDNTVDFTVDSNMTFTMPTDWAKTTKSGNLSNKYWIEIGFTAAPTKPVWIYIRPTTPVAILLEESIDNGLTYDYFTDGDYYPNIWVMGRVVTLFRTSGFANIVVIHLVEGY